MIFKTSLAFLFILAFISTDIRSLEIDEEKLVPYFELGGKDAAKTYRFGYDTKRKGAPRLMREETRLPDGTVIGRYGYTDPFGVFRVVQYVAGNNGYYATEDIGGSSPSKPQFHKATARQLDERVVEDAPKSLSQQLATKFNPPLYHPEAHLADTPPVITKRRLETVEEDEAEAVDKFKSDNSLIRQPKIQTTRRPEFNYYFSLGSRVIAQSSSTPVTEPSVYSDFRDQPVINKRFGVVDDKVINHRNSQFNNISFNTTKHDIYANSDSSDILRVKTEHKLPLKENLSDDNDNVSENIDSDSYTENYDTSEPISYHTTTNTPNHSELTAEQKKINYKTLEDNISTFFTEPKSKVITEPTLEVETTTDNGVQTVGFEELSENIKHLYYNSERITPVMPTSEEYIEHTDYHKFPPITAATNTKPIETTTIHTTTPFETTTIQTTLPTTVTTTTTTEPITVTVTSTESTPENIARVTSSRSVISTSNAFVSSNNSSDETTNHNYDEFVTRNENINNFWQKRQNVLVWPSIVIINNQSNTNNSNSKFFDDYTFESLEVTSQPLVPETIKTEAYDTSKELEEFIKLSAIEYNKTKELTSNANIESVESETKISNKFTYSPLRVQYTSKDSVTEELPSDVTENPTEVTSNTAIKQFVDLMNNENRSFALIYDNTKNQQIFDKIVENIETQTESVFDVSTKKYTTDGLTTENTYKFTETNNNLNTDKVITVRYDSDSDETFGVKISNNQIRSIISDEKSSNDETINSSPIKTTPVPTIALSETEKSIYDFDYSGDLLASAQEITTQSTLTRLPPLDRIPTETVSSVDNATTITAFIDDSITQSTDIKIPITTVSTPTTQFESTTTTLPGLQSIDSQASTVTITEIQSNDLQPTTAATPDAQYYAQRITAHQYLAQPLPMFLGLPNRTPKRKRVRKVMKIRYRIRGSKRLHTIYDNENKNYLLAKDIETIIAPTTTLHTTSSPITSTTSTSTTTTTTTPYPSTTEEDILLTVSDERFEFRTQPKPLFLSNDETISPDMKPFGSRHRGISSYYVPPFSALRLEFEGETERPIHKYMANSDKKLNKIVAKNANKVPISVTDTRNEIIGDNDITIVNNQTAKQNSSLESATKRTGIENESLTSINTRDKNSTTLPSLPSLPPLLSSGSEHNTRSLTTNRIYKSPTVSFGQRHAKYLFPLQPMITQYQNDVRLTDVSNDNVPNNRN